MEDASEDVRKKEIPIAYYRCEECGAEVKWVKNRGLEVLWNPKVETQPF